VGGEATKNTCETEVVLLNDSGLHARPAARLVKVTSRFKSSISIVANGKTANAKSMLSLLSLGAEKGTTLRVIAEGEDAEQAIETIAKLLKEGLGE